MISIIIHFNPSVYIDWKKWPSPSESISILTKVSIILWNYALNLSPLHEIYLIRTVRHFSDILLMIFITQIGSLVTRLFESILIQKSTWKKMTKSDWIHFNPNININNFIKIIRIEFESTASSIYLIRTMQHFSDNLLMIFITQI